MSSNNVQLRSAVNSVEDVVNFLVDESGLPIRSVTVVKDVIAGVILGEVGEVDHEMELAAGVAYIVIGVGKLATKFEPGINFVEIPKR